jgi:peptidase M23-like protein
MVLGLAAVVILFVSMGLNILPMIIAIPVIGLCFALSLLPDDESRQVRWSVRNLIIGLVALAALAVVALLPYETVFLLATVGDWALAVIAVSAVLAMGLPLALSEMPRPRGSEVLLGRRDAVLALTVLVSLAVFHNNASTFLALPEVALILPLVLGAWSVWRGRRGELDLSLWRRPLSKAARPALAQALNRWLFLALAASTIAVGTFSVLQSELPAGGYGTFLVVYLIGLGVLAILSTLSLRPVRLAGNIAVAIASVFLAAEVGAAFWTPAHPVTVGSPVEGQWYVVHGGHSELVNGHNVAVAQDHALDIVQVIDGSSHRGDARDRTNYYAWGEPLHAPADGTVATAVDAFPDQRIGSVDPRHAAGNHLVIDIGGGRFIAMAHLQSGSLRVAVGDRVKSGDVIGLVGNSGNSDEPHLHIQAQNSAVFNVIAPPRGFKNYPLAFTGLTVQRGDHSLAPAAADLRRGDFFSPRV